MSTSRDQNPLINEQLSAWLDDELPPAELELLATRLAASPEHRARVARYGLIGSTLRGGAVGGQSTGLAALRISSRVSAALEGTDGLSAPAVAQPGRRLLPYAIAAAVALATVGLVPILRSVQSPAPVPLQAAMTPVRVQSVSSGSTPRPSQASLTPVRLTNYLVYHGEYSGTLSAKLTDSHIVNNRPYVVARQMAEQPQSR